MIEDIEALRLRLLEAYDDDAPLILSNRDPVDDADGLRANVTFAPGASRRSSASAGQYRLHQLGRIVAIVRDRKGEGTFAANRLAQHIRAIFEEWKTDDLWCGTATVDVYDDLTGYEVQVSIKWESSRLKQKPV